MSIQRLDNLIRAAWYVVDNDFDPRTIYEWRKQALEFLNDNLGPDHYYTQRLKSHIQEMEQKLLLSAGGILAAAREEMLQREHSFWKRLQNL